MWGQIIEFAKLETSRKTSPLDKFLLEKNIYSVSIQQIGLFRHVKNKSRELALHVKKSFVMREKWAFTGLKGRVDNVDLQSAQFTHLANTINPERNGDKTINYHISCNITTCICRSRLRNI